MIAGRPFMPTLVLYLSGQPVIEDFDPKKETQADVEARYGVGFSDYFETREKAEQAVRSPHRTDSYSGFGSLPSRSKDLKDAGES
jgi:hypothetical protein